MKMEPSKLSHILILVLIFISFGSGRGANLQSHFTHNSVTFISQIIGNNLPNCELALVTDYAYNISKENGADFSYIFWTLGTLEPSHAGMYNVLSNSQVDFRRFDDVHRLSMDGSCTNVVILMNEWKDSTMETLNQLLIPAYTSITRKDEDYFFFLAPRESVLDQMLLSTRFGGKIKFKIGLFPSSFQNPDTILVKNVDFYNDVQSGPKIISFEVDKQVKIDKLFPDFTANFRGYPLKLAIPNAPFRFELEVRDDGRYHPKRGTYKPWLDAAMIKLNFTYNCFYSSYEGGTGIRLENGSWVGAVADVRDNVADMAFFIAHIYNRHEVVDWSAPLSYEWIVFVSHKPKYYYSTYAIFWPFHIVVWAAFLISLVFVTIFFKLIASALAEQLKSERVRRLWTMGNSFNYIFTTFLEQDREGPSNLPHNPIRILAAFWLLFALVTANAYRAKLVSVMAFPVTTFVPKTYEELVDSHYGAGMHVIGKGDAAYTIFQVDRGRVYEGIFARLEIINSPLKCLLKAVNEDFGCLMWEGLNDYLNAKNISRRGIGQAPTQVSLTKTSFINDGLIYERRAIIRKRLDDTILNARDSGLTKKWIDLDFDMVRKARFEWETASGKGIHSKSVEDNGPNPLGFENCAASFYILMAGVFVSGFVLLAEFVRYKMSGSTVIAIVPTNRCWCKCTDGVKNLKTNRGKLNRGRINK